jgi:hypothetical protein
MIFNIGAAPLIGIRKLVLGTKCRDLVLGNLVLCFVVRTGGIFGRDYKRLHPNVHIEDLPVAIEDLPVALRGYRRLNG